MKYIGVLIVLFLGIILALFFRNNRAKQNKVDELKAKEELLKNVKQFAGCFQPLLLALSEKDISNAQKFMDIWEKRVLEYPLLHQYFRSMCSDKDPLTNVASWIQTLECWGIEHDLSGSLFVITQEREVLYVFDDIYPMGVKAKVVQPAWWVKTSERTICLETGAAEVQ